MRARVGLGWRGMLAPSTVCRPMSRLARMGEMLSTCTAENLNQGACHAGEKQGPWWQPHLWSRPFRQV